MCFDALDIFVGAFFIWFGVDAFACVFVNIELQLVLETCQMMKLQLLLVLKLWRCNLFMAVHFGFFKSAVRTFGNPQPVQ